jgi:hypothetical protein
MIGVDLIGQIRRAYFDQHRPIKEIVRTLSLSRATVRKVVRGHATECVARSPLRLRAMFRSSVTAMRVLAARWRRAELRISLPPWFQGFVGG